MPITDKHRWGFGLEHEVHYTVGYTPKDIEGPPITELEIVDTYKYVGELITKYKKRLTDDEYEWLFNLYENMYEYSGRRCGGVDVLKRLPFKMPEFVTGDPFGDLPTPRRVNDIWYDLMDEEYNFEKALLKHPEYKKAVDRKNNPMGIFKQASYGMSSYLRVGPKQPLWTDYLGSYHITITLPHTEKTSLERFIKMHQNFANMIQWIEPLLVASYFSCDDRAPGSGKEKRVKGSYRVVDIGWGNLAGSDIRKFSTGVGRYSNILTYWRDGLDLYGVDKLQPCIDYKPDEPGAINGLSTDFRTFGSPDPLHPGSRESGAGMTKPNGIELRIFDNFWTPYIMYLSVFIIYIAENSRTHTPEKMKYVYEDPEWIDAMQSIMTDGWLGRVSDGYVDLLRDQLGLEIATESRIGYEVLDALRVEIYDKHEFGEWTHMMLDEAELKEYNTTYFDNLYYGLPRINQDSWELAFLMKGNSEPGMIDVFRGFLKELLVLASVAQNGKPAWISWDKFSEVFFKHYPKKDWARDVENVAYMLKRMDYVSEIEQKPNGDIRRIELDTVELVAMESVDVVWGKPFDFNPFIVLYDLAAPMAHKHPDAIGENIGRNIGDIRNTRKTRKTRKSRKSVN